MKLSTPVFGLVLPCCVLLGGCQKSEPTFSEVKLSLPDAVALPLVSPGVHQEMVAMPPATTLRYTVSVPIGYDGKTPRPLIVALHDDGKGTPFQGRRMIDTLARPAFDSLGAVAIAPDALDGGDWTTAANEKAVVWLTRCVQKSYSIDPKKVLLTGFGRGGQGTWFLAGRHQDQFKAAIPIAGEPARGDVNWTIPLYVIHSQNDEILPLEPTEKHVAELKGRGTKVELKVINGVTHYQTGKFAGPLRETLPWLKRVWGMP